MIAYLHQSEAHGAVENYVEQLIAGLDEGAVVIAPSGSRLPNLRTFDRAPAPRMLAHLVRELRTLRPRVVHVVDVWPVAQIAARIARVPRVVVTHHTPELPRRENLPGRLLWSLGWLTRPEVIYTSETDRARDGRPNAHVVPLGIDLDRFDVPRTANGRVVGNVARLVEQKDHRTLVEAMGRVSDARLVIAGDGPLRAELEGEGVELLGERDDVPELLAGFDVFAFPSRFEGLCLAVIEAQAAGVPVVATPVGGIPENVVHEETGLLVPVGDAEALAAAINRLLDDRALAERLAAEARRRVRERYSVAAMVHQTLTIYNG